MPVKSNDLKSVEKAQTKDAKKLNKDWIGNSTTYRTLGASNHSDFDRQAEDYYATEPKAVRLLLELEEFDGKIWECSCGEGHLSKEMERLGYEVYSTDLVDRGFGIGGKDFLKHTRPMRGVNIITNPPYKFANEFIMHGLRLLEKEKKIAFFLPIRYLEGKARKKIFQEFPPKVIYVSSSRIKCAMNGDFDSMTGSAVSYCWVVWEKGFTGDTIVKWFN